MLVKTRVRPEFTAGRGLEESLPLSGVGIGDTEQFLLQTLVQGAASFGGGFLGSKLAAGSASGGQTPALQTLAASVAPAGAPGPTGPTGPPALPPKKPLSLPVKVAIGVGVVAVVGGAIWLAKRAG